MRRINKSIYPRDIHRAVFPGMSRFATKSGFTLMELMLSALILAFVLTGMITLFIDCHYLNDSSRNDIIAASHAQTILEDIKLNSTSVSVISSAVQSGNWDLDGDSLEQRFNFTVLPGETSDAEVFSEGDPLGVNVTVAWSEREGRNRSFTIRTLLTK